MAKLVTTAALTRLNLTARRKGFNRKLTKEQLGALDPDGVHVVHTHYPHGDAQCVRCLLFCKLAGSPDAATASIDVTFEDFEALPTYEEWEAALAAKEV